jgi:hypothetical protein
VELALARARGAEAPEAEAVADDKARFAVESVHTEPHLIAARYVRGDGYDLVARLADLRSEHPGLVTLRPEATLARGDRLRRWAVTVIAVTIPLVFAFLVVDFPRRRREVSPSGAARDFQDLELVPGRGPRSDRAACAAGWS